MSFHKYYTPDSFDYIFVEDGISIRFSQPEILNDIFESNLGYSGLNENDLEIYKEFLTKNEYSSSQIEQILKGQKERDYKTTHTIYNKEINKLHGIFSLSKVDEDEIKEGKKSRLMWSHYAKDHTGFMLSFNNEKEFELDNEPDKAFSFREVEYSNIREQFHKQRIPDNTDPLSHLRTKDCAWIYENEFRLIVTTDMQRKSNKTDTKGYPIFTITLNSSAIEYIVIGARADDTLIRKISFWIKQQGRHIPLRKAEPCIEEYKLNYKPIEI